MGSIPAYNRHLKESDCTDSSTTITISKSEHLIEITSGNTKAGNAMGDCHFESLDLKTNVVGWTKKQFF